MPPRATSRGPAIQSAGKAALDIPGTPPRRSERLAPKTPSKRRQVKVGQAGLSPRKSQPARAVRAPRKNLKKAPPAIPLLSAGTANILLNLPAIAILLSTAYMYSTSFNQRLTEDCCHPLWNLIVFMLCGGHLDKLQPTAQIKLWRTKKRSDSQMPDPDTSIATLHSRRKAIIEVVPDFAILYQRIQPPSTPSALQPNFLGTLTFDSLPSWTSLTVGQTFVPLLVELKRPVTRHASNIKQFGYGLLRYMILAQEQAVRQALLLFSSALYTAQDTVVLIAACGHYWTLLHLSKLALISSGKTSRSVENWRRATMDAMADDYAFAEQEEEALEAEFHLPPLASDQLEDEDKAVDQTRSENPGAPSVAEVGGEDQSRHAGDFTDFADSSEVSTTAVDGDGDFRDLGSGQKEASKDAPSDGWVYSWEYQGRETVENELDEEDDRPRLKATSRVATTSSAPRAGLADSKTLHNAFVKEKGKQKVYSTQDLNDWFQLYRPLLVGGDVRGLPPVERSKWHATDARDLNLDKVDLEDMTWSPILQCGTSASTKALNYIAENLGAFVKLQDGRGTSGPSTTSQ
ncbi:hypothetical protein MD484_g4141, partial [Candolleomyces efflorescens]